MARLQVATEAKGTGTGQADRQARVRCSCDHCGAHVMATRSWHLTGSCENCGGFELTPVEPASATDIVSASWPTARQRLVRAAHAWAIQDSNLGPLPYQRSALTD